MRYAPSPIREALCRHSVIGRGLLYPLYRPHDQCMQEHNEKLTREMGQDCLDLGQRVSQPELPPVDGALRLVTSPALYDGGNMFGLTTQMANMAFGAHAALHPSDVERLGLAPEDTVQVRNEHGSISLAVKIEPAVKPGTVWIPASLPGAPVGALLNGGLEVVHVEK